MSFTRGLMCPHTDDDISSTSGGRNKCTCGKVVTNSSLFTAAEWGEMERIRTLVEVRGKDVNLLDSGGYTMLHYAAQHNRVDVVRVDHSGNGATPLHRAAFSGSLESCKLLLEAGADVHSLDTSYGCPETAISKATKQGHKDVVKLLLQFGASVATADTVASDVAQTVDPMASQTSSTQEETESPSTATNVTTSDIHGEQVSESLSGLNLGIACPLCEQDVFVVVRTSCCRKLLCKECNKKLQRKRLQCICELEQR